MPLSARGPLWGKKSADTYQSDLSVYRCSLELITSVEKVAAIILSYFPQSAPLTHTPLSASQPLCLLVSNLVYLLVPSSPLAPS